VLTDLYISNIYLTNTQHQTKLLHSTQLQNLKNIKTCPVTNLRIVQCDRITSTVTNQLICSPVGTMRCPVTRTRHIDYVKLIHDVNLGTTIDTNLQTYLYIIPQKLNLTSTACFCLWHTLWITRDLLKHDGQQVCSAICT
jgi:hypothetical protein